MTVPDAAIEAVKAWLDGVDEYGAEHGYSVADDAFWVQGVSIHNLLAAAEPAFREAIAQEIEATLPDYASMMSVGTAEAARIVRQGESQ